MNTTLAPVVDLALPASAQVMGTRSVLATPPELLSMRAVFLPGCRSMALRDAAKHFPGLGGGAVDSHFETPKIRRGWNGSLA